METLKNVLKISLVYTLICAFSLSSNMAVMLFVEDGIFSEALHLLIQLVCVSAVFLGVLHVVNTGGTRK